MEDNAGIGAPVTLESLAEESSPITYGVVKPGDEGTIRFVRGGDVSNGKVHLDDLRTITQEVSDKYKRTLLRGGEVLVSLVGEYLGQVGIAPPEIAGANIARQVGLVRLRPSVDPRFILYFLISPQGKQRLLAHSLGSVQKVINLKDLKTVEVPLPPLETQKSIAHILGTLDDKIELNRRMNETLESMARALFKSWFVDFDPVIDNALAAGNPIPEPLSQRAQTRRDLGTHRKPLPKNIQKLLPDAFAFTDEMGWIPEGWETAPVYEVAQFINGAAFKSSHFCANEDGLPVVKIAELKNGISAQTKFTDRDMDDKYSIKNGEVLFSWSGSPDTSIDTFVWSGGEGWLNQHIFKVSFHKVNERSFVYSMLKHLKPKFVEIARDKQTTGLGHITAGDMKRLLVVKPVDSLCEYFASCVDPILHRAFETNMQSKKLAKLRDTLLPKLLSGELRIPDAEKLVAGSL